METVSQVFLSSILVADSDKGLNVNVRERERESYRSCPH